MFSTSQLNLIRRNSLFSTSTKLTSKVQFRKPVKCGLSIAKIFFRTFGLPCLRMKQLSLTLILNGRGIFTKIIVWEWLVVSHVSVKEFQCQRLIWDNCFYFAICIWQLRSLSAATTAGWLTPIQAEDGWEPNGETSTTTSWFFCSSSHNSLRG